MIGIGDWDYHQSWSLAGYRSIMEYGQLPMWSPWHCGGMDFVENLWLVSILLHFVDPSLWS